MEFDVETARRDLIAKRAAAGADTPIGHRCSNLIEQLEHYQATSEPWRSLWLAAEAKEPTDDGWHFVRCPSCNRTGLRPDANQ